MNFQQKEKDLLNVAEKSNNVVTVSKAKSKKSRNPFLDTLSKSRNVYKRQIVRNAQTKKNAIEHILKLTDRDANMDDLVFLGNFYNLVEFRLLDSKRFMNECERLDLDAFNVAQHVIFDGNKKLDEVLNFGLEQTYTTELVKMKDAIFSKEELEKARVSKVDDADNDAA